MLYNDFFTSMVLNEANGKPTDGVTPPDDPPDFTKEQQPDAGADPNAAPPDNADAAEQAPPEEQPQDDQGGDPNAEGQPEEDPNTNLSAPILDENNNTVDEPEITTTTITEKDAPEENIWKAFLSWKNFQLGIFCFCGPCKN